MKKILSVFFCLFLFISCGEEKQYDLVYRVYYPGNPKTYHIIIDDKLYNGSDRGTNYLYAGGRKIIATSAPIEVVSYKEIQKYKNIK